MNSLQSNEEKLVQTMPPMRRSPICAVHSITYTPERRIIRLASTVPELVVTRPAVNRRLTPFLLRILMGPESASSFRPVVQVRTPTKS